MNATGLLSGTAPVVSVIIVTWNGKQYAEECLSSFRRNANVATEIIVVDNASSDGTPQLVSEKFPEVRLIENTENLGFAKGNNVGIAQSSGKYLFLVNSDVNVPPDCVSKLVAYMEANPEVGLLGPQMLGPGGGIRRSSMRSPSLWNMFCRALALDSLFNGRYGTGGLLMSDFRHCSTIEVEVLNGWFWVVRRTALEQVGLLDERFFMYGEDLDWSYRFRKLGWKVVFCAEASAIHYGGASSAVAPTRFYIEMKRANFQYWTKYNGRLSFCAYYGITAFHELVRIAGYSVAFLARPASRQISFCKIQRSWALLHWLARPDGQLRGAKVHQTSGSSRPEVTQ